VIVWWEKLKSDFRGYREESGWLFYVEFAAIVAAFVMHTIFE